jgi:hypothetical protein
VGLGPAAPDRIAVGYGVRALTASLPAESLRHSLVPLIPRPHNDCVSRGHLRSYETGTGEFIKLSGSDQLTTENMGNTLLWNQHGSARQRSFNRQIHQRLRTIAGCPDDLYRHGNIL